MWTTFGPTCERLVALKDEYDPTNPFGLDQNTAPSGSVRTDGGVNHE
nr:BBE domain-containing protein [Halosolutus halophilus]